MQTSTQKETARKASVESDIVNIILEDHKALKELIEVMKDSEKSQEERFAAFEEFAPTLIAHAKPEEASLYKYMKQNEELKEEGCEGEVEHMLADQLVEEIKRASDNDMKAAQIKVLAELVEHHIEEEESELLPDFKKEAEPQIRARLGDQFLELKVQYLAAGDENIIPDEAFKAEENNKTH
jgi:hypothetical protein